jgi:hypothetical protein
MCLSVCAAVFAWYVSMQQWLATNALMLLIETYIQMKPSNVLSLRKSAPTCSVLLLLLVVRNDVC